VTGYLSKHPHYMLWPGLAMLFFGARDYGEHLGRTPFGSVVHGQGWFYLAILGFGLIVTAVVCMDNELSTLRRELEWQRKR
jgi:hypothetical protein